MAEPGSEGAPTGGATEPQAGADTGHTEGAAAGSSSNPIDPSVPTAPSAPIDPRASTSLQCRTAEDYNLLSYRKRWELDREIEAFQAEKDREFKLYQRGLKKEYKDGNNQQKGADAAGDASVAAPAVAAAAGPSTSSRASGASQGSSRGIAEAQQADKSSYGGRSQRAKHPLQERDEELQGVFTQSFLPLLEVSDHYSAEVNKGKGKGKEVVRVGSSTSSTSGANYTTSEAPPTNRHKKRSSAPAATPISSSLTLDRNIFSSISNDARGQQQQASSAPRPGLADRRSSSRSDTSTTSGGNLRSVLRQPRSPDGGNKSPKHVLFSIDNTVVAPSSSPSITRRQATAAAAAMNCASGEAGSDAAPTDGTQDESMYLPSQTAASVLSVRSLPPGLRMTPVRVPGLPTPPLGSTFWTSALPNRPAATAGRPSSADSEGPTSHPVQMATSDVPTSTPAQTSNQSRSAPFFDGSRTTFAPMRRVSSGESSIPSTPTSATRAADLLDPTVPVEERESAGGVPDVLASELGADPLFDFDDDSRDWGDYSEGRGTGRGSGGAGGSRSGGSGSGKKEKSKAKKKGKKTSTRGREENESIESLESLEDEVERAMNEGAGLEIGGGGSAAAGRGAGGGGRAGDEGARPGSLPIEIRWKGRKRSR